MQWIAARLREDSTRSALGQLAVLVVLVALIFGVDVEALLTRAEASADRILVLVTSLGGAAAIIARIVTPQPPPVLPPLPDAALKGLERLGLALEERQP